MKPLYEPVYEIHDATFVKRFQNEIIFPYPLKCSSLANRCDIMRKSIAGITLSI